jgi:hypothetical protein
VRLSDALMGRMMPRRDGLVVPIAPLRERAVDEVSAALDARKEALDDRGVRLKGLRRSSVRQASEEQDALLVSVADFVHVSMVMDDWPAPAVPAVVDGLVREAGLAHAVDVVLTSVMRPIPATRHVDVSLGDPDFVRAGRLSRFERARELIAHSEDADYASAKASAAKWFERGAEAQRVAAAFLFPGEGWAEQLLPAIGRRMSNPGLTRALLFSVKKIEACEGALVEEAALWGIPDPLLGTIEERDVAATVLEIFGIQGMSWLAAHVPELEGLIETLTVDIIPEVARARREQVLARIFETLAAIEHPAARKKLKSFAKWPEAARWL